MTAIIVVLILIIYKIRCNVTPLPPASKSIPSSTWLWIAIPGLFAACAICPWLVSLLAPFTPGFATHSDTGPNPSSELEQYAQLGDMFGALNALIAGLAFIFFIRSLELQREDLRNQKEELHLQREEMEKSRIESERQTQQFIAQTRLILKQIKLQEKNNNKKEYHDIIHTINSCFDSISFEIAVPGLLLNDGTYKKEKLSGEDIENRTLEIARHFVKSCSNGKRIEESWLLWQTVKAGYFPILNRIFVLLKKLEVDQYFNENEKIKIGYDLIIGFSSKRSLIFHLLLTENESLRMAPLLNHLLNENTIHAFVMHTLKETQETTATRKTYTAFIKKLKESFPLQP